MFRKKLVALMMVTVLAASFIACSNAANESDNTAATTETTQAANNEQTTTSGEEASVKAEAEELSKRADEIKASMAAAVEQAAKEADEKERAIEESKAAEAASEAEAMNAAIAEVSNRAAQSSDEVITVIDSYGVESARLQYGANYKIYVELVRLTNELRASLGVAPLKMDENICIASCKKAVDYYLSGYYDGPNHTMIDGRRWQALYDDFNISATAKAENLAKGPAYKTAQQMFDGWKNSSVHYTNMVDPDFTRVGVGSCGYVWLMDFAN